MGTTKTLSRKKSKKAPSVEPLVPKRDTMDIDNRRKASNAIESLFGNMLSRIETEAKEAITNQKARAHEAEQLALKVKAEAEQTIAEVKAKAEEKEKDYETTIDRLKAEHKEKQKDYAQQIAETKAQGQEAIAKIKAEHKEHIKELKAEAEEAIAQVKTEAKEAMAQVKTEAKEAIAEQKAKVAEIEQQAAKTQADGKEAVAKVKAEARQKEKAYDQQIARTKIENQEAITELRAEYEEQIAKITAEYEERIAKIGTQAEEQIAKINAEHEDLVAKLKTEAEAASGSVSEAIRKMVDSPAVLPGQQSLAALDLCAKDIMQEGVVWASPDDTIQNALATMQRCTTDYVMVGDGTTLTGIVSRSDLSASLSPYLRPAFAKWRRPLDDATLQIKLKWVMSRPVHIINPKMTLAAVIKNMCRCRVRCLPVVDPQGKVHGLVAEVNIFKALLKVKNAAQAGNPDETLLEETLASTPSSPDQIPPHKDSENLTPATSATL